MKKGEAQRASQQAELSPALRLITKKYTEAVQARIMAERERDELRAEVARLRASTRWKNALQFWRFKRAFRGSRRSLGEA